LILIVRGRAHFPDEIGATIHENTRGRCATIVPEEGTEQLVVIIEVKRRAGRFDEGVSADAVGSEGDVGGQEVVDL
jgi:hypothetical protein